MTYSAVCNTRGSIFRVLVSAIVLLGRMRIAAFSCYECEEFHRATSDMDTDSTASLSSIMEGPCKRRQKQSSTTHIHPAEKFCYIEVMTSKHNTISGLSDVVTMDMFGLYGKFSRSTGTSSYKPYAEVPANSRLTNLPNQHTERMDTLVVREPEFPTMENLGFSPSKYFCTYMKPLSRDLILLCVCEGELCNWHSGDSFIHLLQEPTINISAMIQYYGTPWFELESSERKYKCYTCSDTRPDGNCVADGNYDTLDCCNGCNITLRPGGNGIVDRGCYGNVPPDPPSGAGLDCHYIPHPNNPNGIPGYECACLRTDFCNGIPWLPGKWEFPPGPVNGTPWYPHLTPAPPVTRSTATTAKPTTPSTTTTTTTTAATEPPSIDGC